jgi:Serine/threonine protein kinase
VVTDSNELLGQTLGTCTLQRLLGRGGMGAVYLARQSRPRRTVAVKVLLPSLMLEQHTRHEFLARFRREADAVAALDHINIMPVYEYGEQGDIAYLVMPYVTGGTLRDVLEARHILPLEEAIPIIEQAAAALDAAHALSIVHRDLKPGNILFHADGRVLLADFGLAKVLKDVTDQEGSNGHLTSIGTIVGTPEYLSPEQGTGDAVDYRTDEYSLGVVLYQMLAGRVPFTGPSPVAVAIKHALEQPPLPSRFNPAIPPKVEAVIMKAMAKKPYQRYDSAGEFAVALRQAAVEELGEQFLRVDPTPRADYHATPALPSLDSSSNERQPTSSTPILPERHTDDGEDKNTPTGIQQTGEALPSMSTVLMDSEHEQEDNFAPRVEARLSKQTKDRLPALPTVITNPNDMLTVANYQQGAQRPGQQLRLRPGQQQQAYAPPAGSTERQQPIRQVPQAVTPVQRQVPTYPQRPTQRSGPKLLPIISVSLAVLVIVVASFTLTSVWGKLYGSKTPVTTSGTQSATRGTPQAQHTPGAGSSGTPYALPNPMANVGSPIYSTNYPANCDGKSNWTMQGVNATCQSGIVKLTNTGSGNGKAGAFTSPLATGQSYYVQVQVTSQSSAPFSLYFYNTAGSAYKIVVDPVAGNWTFNYINNSGTQSLAENIPLQVRSPQTLTIGFLVQSNNFYAYANGKRTEGHATTGFGIPNGNTSVGIGVDNGQSIYIKNFTVYSAS